MVRAGGQSVTLACPAMGTRFELLLKGADSVALRSAGEAAIEEIQRWHTMLSAFDNASVTSRLNREAVVRPTPVPPDFADIFRWCLQASVATGGAFDIAVGHLMHRAGFRDAPRAGSICSEGAEGCSHGPSPHDRAEPVENSAGTDCTGRGGGLLGPQLKLTEATPPPPPPPRLTIDAANRVHFTHFICLDFGAIGKGWALDRAVEILIEHGVTSALLHGGTSSITTIGDDNGHPWRVALGEGGPVVDFAGGSLGLSAPSGRQVTDAGGVTHGHILDPRTGLSVRSLTEAAVIGPSAAVCDAWSTALMVDPTLSRSANWPAGYRALTNTGSGFQSAHPSPTNPSSLQGCVH